MKLSREEAIRNFREHWASLAITGTDKKDEYLKRQGLHGIKHNCFLCELTNQECGRCPVEWPKILNNGEIFPCTKSYFIQWANAADPEERKRLAALIRDLPEKKKEPKPDFKIDDWVKVIHPGGTHSSWEDFFTENNLMSLNKGFKINATPKAGDVLQIKGHSIKPFNPYGFVYALQASNGQVFIMSNTTNSIEPAEPPKPEPKYKVGQKVVPVDTPRGWDSFDRYKNSGCFIPDFLKENGFLFIIRMYDETAILSNSPTCGCGDTFNIADLRPYVEPPTFKFAVGDKVRAIAASEGNGWGDVQKGDVGVITHTPENHPCKNRGEHYVDRYRAAFPNQNLWDGKEECFEHVVSEPKPEVKPEPIINHCPEPKTLTSSTTFIFKGNKTTCIIEIDGRKFKGVARCDPKDEWNEDIGRQWAEIRANRKMIDAVERELKGQ